MRLKSIYIVLTIIFVIGIYSIIAKTHGDNMKITKEQAIEIANKEAKKLGYDVMTMDLKVTKYNTAWNEYLPKDSESKYIIERKNKLANKEYWAMYYYPKLKENEVVKGGDVCIFIDSNKGIIITNIRGK